MIEGFLIGVIATTSITAGACFLRFWRRTHDRLFLAFAAAFIIEGLNRTALLVTDKAGEGSLGVYSVRLVAFTLILIAIAAKNRSPR